MSRNFKFFISLMLFLLSTNLAFALTCRNDYSGTSGCADNKTPAGTCETLGYYTDDVENCGHYIYCPFDTNYKRCTKASACDIKCKGFYTCNGDGRTPIGDVECTCGNVNYYKRCQVVETCDTSGKYENGGSCSAYTQVQVNIGTYTKGKYLVGDKCTTINLSKVYLYADCTTAKDCEGNPGPAYGLKTCQYNQGSGKTVTCGDYKYFESCNETCDTSSKYENGGYCSAYTNTQVINNYTKGYYLIGDKCTKLDNTKVYWYANCTTAKDCEGNQGAAYGLKECDYYKEVGSGKSVTCGRVTFYEKCEKKETCDTESSFENGGYCRAYKDYQFIPGYTDKGQYLVGDKCTTSIGTKIYWYGNCTGTDCKGNKGPAYGLKTCASGYYAVGTIVKCGGNVYGSDCAATCNYELQASDCAENQSFVAHCRDYNNVEFGECVNN